MQVPSKVSAIKIDGVRSYKRAREGEDFEIPARPVTVSSFAVYDVRDAVAEDGTPVLDLVVSVVCSSGTYIRALARDLGAGLGVGGHLTALRRTRVGPYELDAARTLDQLQEELTVMPIAEAAAAAFPRWDVDDEAGPAAAQRRTAGDARGVRGRRRRGRLRPRRALPGPGRGAEGQGEEPGRLRLRLSPVSPRWGTLPARTPAGARFPRPGTALTGGPRAHGCCTAAAPYVPPAKAYCTST